MAAGDYETWLYGTVLPVDAAPLAPHHHQFWEWVWDIRPGVRPTPFIGCWPRGGAKALATSTPIPTPDGWTTMGDLAPGSMVYAHDGSVVSVIEAHPIDVRPCHRVHFNDGTSIVASDDHLWTVLDVSARRQMAEYEGGLIPAWPTWKGIGKPPRRACEIDGCDHWAVGSRICGAHQARIRLHGDPRAHVPLRRHRDRTPFVEPPEGSYKQARAKTLTTTDILSEGLLKGNEKRWAIPTTTALAGLEALLPVDPYLLGYWLGDGTSSAGVITVGREDLAAVAPVLAVCGFETKVHDRDTAHAVQFYGLLPYLRTLGVYRNKHVPPMYARASSDQRLAVLQGLLDSDGTVHHAAASVFCAINERLANDTAELARSLGLRPTMTKGRASIGGVDCGPVFKVRIPASGVALHRLPRKRDALAAKAAKSMRLSSRLRYITAIERAPDQPCRCVVVDHPDHLYLAGEGMVPTHNSSSAEFAAVAFAARRVRKYGLYVSGTQQQADDHVGNVADILESDRIAANYPDLSDRAVNKFGASKGWRRQRLRTASGFTVDALGLDTSARGIKLENQRPDFIVLDDVDSEDDSAETIRKKIDKITKKLLPAGSSDLAILAIQNLVHIDSIFARLVGVSEHKVDFLANKIVSGPLPAIRDLEYRTDDDGRFVLVSGVPVWEGQNLATCQAQVDDWGFTAFMSEAQQEVEVRPGGMYNHIDFDAIRVPLESVPTLSHVVVWIDPAVSDTDQSDACAIQCDGLGADGRIYRLFSWEQRTSPQKAMLRALEVAQEWTAEAVGVETDQGGDTWRSVFAEAWRIHETNCRDRGVEPHKPSFRHDKAGALKLPGSSQPAKAERSARMLSDYERGLFRHVEGTHTTLERSLRRFPLTKPLDLADAAFWSWHDLRTRYGKGDTKAAAGAMQWNVEHLTRPNPNKIY